MTVIRTQLPSYDDRSDHKRIVMVGVNNKYIMMSLLLSLSDEIIYEHTRCCHYILEIGIFIFTEKSLHLQNLFLPNNQTISFNTVVSQIKTTGDFITRHAKYTYAKLGGRVAASQVIR